MRNPGETTQYNALHVQTLMSYNIHLNVQTLMHIMTTDFPHTSVFYNVNLLLVSKLTVHVPLFVWDHIYNTRPNH